MWYTDTLRLLIPVLALAFTFLVAGCEDDPIIGPTDEEPSGGGSYGIIHFDASGSDTSAERLEQFRNENPKRF